MAGASRDSINCSPVPYDENQKAFSSGSTDLPEAYHYDADNLILDLTMGRALEQLNMIVIFVIHP